MERWFHTLTEEMPPFHQIRSTEQLHEVIAMTIHYYNHRRRHSSLGNMSPAAYAASLQRLAPLRKQRDRVFAKKVA